MTRVSTHSAAASTPWEYYKDSVLDPDSDNFQPRAFIKSMLSVLRDEGEDRYADRCAGFSFRNLNVHGVGSGTDFQKSVGNVLYQGIAVIHRVLGTVPRRKLSILRHFDGLVYVGEMLVVLGPLGSGCSTFLKTITGETHGFNVNPDSIINYQGIDYRQMHQQFRGEALYTAEVDVHFPQLTVGNTLYFAARAQAPRNIPGHISRKQYALNIRNMIMATFGIQRTVNTKVGDDFVQGISGGKRKRVTIAEVCLSGSPLQA